jgi:hypothetical protein
MVACRVCLEEDKTLVSPCKCKGFDHGSFHPECLNQWIQTSGNKDCEICHEEFLQREVCALNCRRYCRQVWCCGDRGELEESLLLATVLNFLSSFIVLFFTPTDGLATLSMINTFVVVFMLAYVQWHSLANEYMVLNVACAWKTGFTIALVISLLIRDSFSFDECSYNCYTINVIEGCSKECYYYIKLTGERSAYVSAVFTSCQDLAFLLLIRLFVICFTHMRKRTFREYDGSCSEREGLLEEGPANSSSDSSSGAV